MKTTRGTIAADVPTVVCTMARVKGRIATMRMMKGMERKTLITGFRTALTTRLARMPPSRVTTRATPRTKPRTDPMASDTNTMYSVSKRASRNCR